MSEYIERQEVYSEINKLPLTEDAAMEILWAVDKIPTADVVPVVHGRWESSELQFENDCTMCSECKTEFYIPDLIAESGNEYPNCCGYCPNCGAKMDGEPHDP